MAYASRAGRARTSARSPQAHAFCDRCGGRFNHVDLSWQIDWAGASMVNKRILVCHTCLDEPQQQLRAIILQPDPVPILNPRPGNNAKYATDVRVASEPGTTDVITGLLVPDDDNVRVTQDSNPRVVQQTGFAQGSLNEEPGTDANAPGDNNPGLPYNTTEVPKTGPI
jgi:hypothetical protein